MADLQQLQASVWQCLLKRLTQSQIQTNALEQAEHGYLMPSNLKHEPIWEQLCTGTSIFLSNRDLTPVLSLEQSTAASKVQIGLTSFYIRSWHLTVGQLAKIIDTWDSQEVRHEEADAWTLALQGQQLDKPVFIRYIGQTWSKTPYERLRNDLRNRKQGVLYDFCSTLQVLFPAVYKSAEAFEFLPARATLDNSEASQHLRDDVERLYIHLMHPKTLLNRQTGGVYVKYSPAVYDLQLFRTLQTKVCTSLGLGQKISKTSQLGQHPLANELRSLVDECAEFASDHGEVCGTNDRPVTQKVRDVWFRQALPPPASANRAVAILGSWPTQEDFETGYWNGGSRSAQLQKDFWSRICSWEQMNDDSDALRPWPSLHCVYAADSSQLFPLWDLWRWTTRSETDSGAKFMQRYLSVTRPIITITQSLVVSSLVAGSFVYAESIPDGVFIREVGVPRIVYYASTDWLRSSSEPPRDQCTIQIPALDPGAVKYRANRIALLMYRVLDLTYYVGWTAMDQMFRNPMQDDEARLGYCVRLKAAISQQLNNCGFTSIFEQAKKALIDAEITNSTKKPVRIRGLASRSEQHAVMFILARGEPYSVERLQQATTLWEKEMPELHASYPRKRRAEWMRWALSIDTGCSFLLADYKESTHMAERITELMMTNKFKKKDTARNHVTNELQSQRLFEALAPLMTASQAMPEDLNTLRQAAFEAMNPLVRQCFNQAMSILQLKPSNDASKELGRPRTSLQGAIVNVHGGCQLAFTWLTQEKEKVKFSLFILPEKYIGLKDTDDHRTIHFNPDGLDVHDSADVPIRWDQGSEGASENLDRLQVSAPFRELYVLKDGRRLVQLWEKEMGLKALHKLWLIHGISDAGNQLPVTWFGAAGKEPSLSIAFNSTPSRGDVAWLLKQFIDDKYPVGGTVILRNPVYGRDTASFLPQCTSYFAFLHVPQSPLLWLSSGAGKQVVFCKDYPNDLRHHSVLPRLQSGRDRAIEIQTTEDELVV